EIIAEVSKRPDGVVFRNTGSANALQTDWTVTTSARTRMALLVTFCSRTPTHWLVKSSVTAVPNMHININIKRGESIDLYMAFVEIPEDTLSVTGKSSFQIIQP